jgi:DNA-binding HxlR family transcriptional regulator
MVLIGTSVPRSISVPNSNRDQDGLIPAAAPRHGVDPDHDEVIMTGTPGTDVRLDADTCAARAILDQVADKWALYVVAALDDGEMRFTELKRAIDGISQRMLTVTLRGLERDGLVTRTIYSPMPPNIAYRLTPLGATLRAAASPLVRWAKEHRGEIDAAQRRYDEAGC